jgi:hypothetical protein
MKLAPAHRQLLHAINNGETLKVQRDIEGRKLFRLYTPAGAVRLIEREAVEALFEAGLIASNQKFPTATYWLTPAGRQVIGASDTSTP